jgi:hypothetical protein
MHLDIVPISVPRYLDEIVWEFFGTDLIRNNNMDSRNPGLGRPSRTKEHNGLWLGYGIGRLVKQELW